MKKQKIKYGILLCRKQFSHSYACREQGCIVELAPALLVRIIQLSLHSFNLMASREDVQVDLLHGTAGQDTLKEVYGSTSNRDKDSIENAIHLQDQALDDLSVGVRNVRNIAGQVHDEVDTQLKMIDGVDVAVDDSRARVANTTARTRENRESAYTIRNFCLLLWPLVLFIVLIFEAIIHFLFRYP